MKIVHICTGYNRASGISAFCVNVAREQLALGHSVAIVYSRGCEVPLPDGVRSICAPSIEATGLVPDLVHIHGLWSMLFVETMRWCLGKRIPYIVSPHGSLMPRVFTKNRLKKWVAWRFLLKRKVQRALLVHCTGENEVGACRALGLCRPCVIAPLGCQIPQTAERLRTLSDDHVILFLGRISEEKGLINLLEVWRHVNRAGWRLKIVGPDWREYKAVLEEKIARERIEGIEFVGLADAEMKDRLYREASVFVLPSPMENFSMVVLDALAYGVPVIATKGTPWRELESAHCGWWIDQGELPLRQALEQAMSLSDDERENLGRAGRNLAKQKYVWSTIVRTFDLSVRDELAKMAGKLRNGRQKGGSCR